MVTTGTMDINVATNAWEPSKGTMVTTGTMDIDITASAANDSKSAHRDDGESTGARTCEHTSYLGARPTTEVLWLRRPPVQPHFMGCGAGSTLAGEWTGGGLHPG
jgi:hypothetical protein